MIDTEIDWYLPDDGNHKDNKTTEELIGCFAKLWLTQSPYAQVALDVAMHTWMTIIQSRNYILFFHQGEPIGYACWAFLNEGQVNDYIYQRVEYISLLENGLFSSEKTCWLLSLYCVPNRRYPSVLRRILEKYVFQGHLVYFLYHKSTAEKTIIKCRDLR